jgi:ribosomal protein S4
MATTFTLSRFKACRKVGVALWPWRHFSDRQLALLVKLAKRNRKQKQHQEKKKKRSQFFYQLQAKQLVTYVYGKLQTRYLCTLFQKCASYKGKTAANFLVFLEKRLDITLYRVQFAPTLAATRQLITHQKICVNQKVMTKPGYFLQPGDIVSVLPSTRVRMGQTVRRFLRAPATQDALHRMPIRRRRRQRKIYKIRKTSITTKVFYKPLHLEVNYALLSYVFLYTPQQLYYPMHLSLTNVAKAFRR